MKKPAKIALGVIGIITVLIFAGLFFTGKISNTAIYNVAYLQCFGGGSALDCVQQGSSTIGNDNNGAFGFTLTNNVYQDFSDNFISLWRQQNATVDKFFSTSVACYNSNTYTDYANAAANRDSNGNLIDTASTYSFIANPNAKNADGGKDSCPFYYFHYSKYAVKDYFANQLIVMSGNIFNNFDAKGTPIGQFTAYGFCGYRENTGKTDCSLTLPENVKPTDAIVPTSIKVYLRYGGFANDNTVCVQQGIESCQGQNLYVCGSNFAFVSQGLVNGKCGYTSANVSAPTPSSSSGNTAINPYNPTASPTYQNTTLSGAPANPSSSQNQQNNQNNQQNNQNQQNMNNPSQQPNAPINMGDIIVYVMLAIALVLVIAIIVAIARRKGRRKK